MEKMTKFRSIILAGERPGGSPISQAFNVAASVMVPVADKPALARVMQAIEDSQFVDAGMISGPTDEIRAGSPGLTKLLSTTDHLWQAQSTGPAASAAAAVKKLSQFPILLTAGDHALLTGEIVDHFCESVLLHNQAQEYDVIIGFVPHELVKAAWPESKRTVLKFKDGRYCGSNLFAIMNANGLKALEFWQQAEADRKKPWRIARRFGLMALLYYVFRRLTLQDALQGLSTAANCRLGFVPVNFARAAVDVDSIEDQKLAEKILRE
jgi:hypothetical protein